MNAESNQIRQRGSSIEEVLKETEGTREAAPDILVAVGLELQ
jgi:hypothetical protein